MITSVCSLRLQYKHSSNLVTVEAQLPEFLGEHVRSVAASHNQKITICISSVYSVMLPTSYYVPQGNDVRFNDDGIRDIDKVRILQYLLNDDGIHNDA